MRELTYAEALFEAVDQEMARDPSVFVYGLGVDDPKGIYGTTKDLHVKYGADRNFDTPLSEDAMTGFGIGAAMAGFRPIHVHQRVDFLLLCMNQLINMAAKMRYMFAGEYSVPFVTRAVVGRSWGQGAQHSQALHSLFMHIPGLKVVAPTSPHDAKGCLIAAIRDNNPIVFMEHRLLYAQKGIVPEEAYTTDLGQARVLKEGTDITIVGISQMVAESLRAAHALEKLGLSVEVVDPVTLAPLDLDSIAKSVTKTGRLLVVDSGWTMCGASSEIIAGTLERISELSVRFARMGFAPTPCPTTKVLEQEFYPSAQAIADKALDLLDKKGLVLPMIDESQFISEFKGPF